MPDIPPGAPPGTAPPPDPVAALAAALRLFRADMLTDQAAVFMTTADHFRQLAASRRVVQPGKPAAAIYQAMTVFCGVMAQSYAVAARIALEDEEAPGDATMQ